MSPQAFCHDHWSELAPRINRNEVNGIALQPLALEALWAHGAVEEEFADVIAAAENDAEAVAVQASPICCWLEGRTRYADGTDFEDDYAILIAMGTTPLDDPPDAFWVDHYADEEGGG